MNLGALACIFLVLSLEFCSIDCSKYATKCYKCNDCTDLETAEIIECASYWNKLANYPYDTVYSCQTLYTNVANVTKYTLTCTPFDECTIESPSYDNDGTRKWSKCCQDNLCNMKLVNSGKFLKASSFLVVGLVFFLSQIF